MRADNGTPAPTLTGELRAWDQAADDDSAAMLRDLEDGPMEMPIDWYRSKTLWLQLVKLVAALLAVFAGSELVAAHPQWAAAIVAGEACVGTVLRLLTVAPIALPVAMPEVPRP